MISKQKTKRILQLIRLSAMATDQSQPRLYHFSTNVISKINANQQLMKIVLNLDIERGDFDMALNQI